jgi:hypothetical protein
MSFLYPSFLTLHLVALTIMAGSTLINYLGYRTLWNLLPGNTGKADGVLTFLGKFGRIVSIGAAMLIVSGLAMMVLTKGVYGEQLWFRIKFVTVIFIVANAIVYRRKVTFKLQQSVEKDNSVLGGDLSDYKRHTRNFHIVQLILFVAIIILSVFKFN